MERRVIPYILIAPNALIFILFIAVPALFGLRYSLTEWSGIGTAEFVGLGNYVQMFQDTRFWYSMSRTCIYTLVSLPLIMIFPLMLAQLLIKEIRFRGFFRAAFYWPSMLSYIVVGCSFKFIFGDNTGVINYLLEVFGAEPVGWLTQGATAMAVVILATTWSRTGFYMVLYISGLQNISESYYEAAVMDGASGWQRFRYITLPLLKPTTFMVILLGFIDLFKAYGLVISLTDGGPASATKFAVQYIYEQAFQRQKLGYASALSMTLFVILAVVTVILFFVNKGGAIDDQ